MSFVTQKVIDLPSSGIRKFFDVAAEMKDVVSLGVGEPDFFTPWNVREEAIFSLEHRRTAYTSNAGLPALREAVCDYMQERYSLKYSPSEQVVITVGVSEAIDIALRAIIEPGDEILVAEPCYVSYRACVMLAGGVPITVPTYAEHQFRVQAKDIEERITPRTKAIMLCYPNNPTGAIMERADLEKICEVLKKHEILVISDEVYAELTYAQDEHVSIASLPDMYERTLVLNGFSKAYAMTGWRLGFACGPKDLIAAMIKIHQYVIMCAPTTAQLGGVEALKNGKSNVEKMRSEYDVRRRFMVDSFRKLGIKCFEPLGAFYLFPYIGQYGLSSEEFCNRLLMEQRLAVVPGTAFGECGEGFVRCSYAYSLEELKKALERLARFLGE
ncbi:MAG: aminotransferase class I/II-fold pyridoxal phosphate-dependent enzyme [Defluviitaleaceae bacterium]|nr:aminotransferase class I/II-fold pyridoxal phosphate-dependent enzyme [Defluviitaleaceae bacterium]